MTRRLFYILFVILLPCSALVAAPKLVSTRIQTLNLPKKNLKLSDTLNIAILANIYPDTRPDSLIQANYPADSLLAVKAAMALKSTLQDSPVFTDYDFPVYNYSRTDSKTTKTALPIDVIKQVASDVQANYLITVDIVSTDIWYEAGRSQNYDNVIYASTNVPYQFVFRVYDIQNSRLSDEQMITDTLVFETSSTEVTDAITLLKQLTTGADAVIKAGEQAGANYAESIVPHWIEEIRYYYRDNSKEMKNAEKFVENQQWSDAIDVWMQLTTSTDYEKAAMACFNMALGCEMTGNFELAIEWLNLAKKKNPRVYIPEYETVLENRMKDKAELDKILR